jgi:hypothetical protein
MLHEAHTSPLAMLNFNPRSRYYGATTTSAFYAVALSLLWHWTGDKTLVAPLIETTLEALHWLDTYGMHDDGFYYYQSRFSNGTENQAGKIREMPLLILMGHRSCRRSLRAKSRALSMPPNCNYPKCSGRSTVKTKLRSFFMKPAN